MDQENTLATAPAVYALLAVALNTMSLQSGDTLGIPRKWTFVCRVSPIFCLNAALDSVFRLAKYTVDNRSLAEGSKEWITHRFGGIDPRPQRTLTAWTFVQIAFIIGVLSQAIKIYATSNIVYIQLFCTAYIADYLIETVTINFAAQRPSDAEQGLSQPVGEGQQRSSSPSDGLQMFALCAILGYLPVIWAICYTFPERERIFDAGARLAMTLVTLASLVTPPSLAGANNSPGQDSVLLVGFTLADLSLFSVSMQLAWTPGAQVRSELLCIQLVFALGTALSLIGGTLHVEQHDDELPVLNPECCSRLQYLTACKFLVTHALGAYIYFSAVYKVEETARPAWTNYLP